MASVPVTTLPKRLFIGQPLLPLAKPSTATLSIVADANSTLTAATYYVTYTYENEWGETLPYATTLSASTNTGEKLVLDMGTFPAEATKANIYMGTSSGGMTWQAETTLTSYTRATDITTDGKAVPTQNESSEAYEVPTGMDTVGLSFTFHNTTTGAADVSLYVVTPGKDRATTNQLFSRSVAAADTIEWDWKGVISEGDAIHLTQKTSGAITTYVSGVEVSK